ncbi:hypothetical protein QFW82_45365 [Streptomyces malaysiensis subsp. malaysiensis]|uniref:hypothetical protein n=1 Tax=Streptomyces malaysiensis TaxID=92644 RepID=UPI001F1B8B28|nr:MULTISPECIES: hypothetical protein [Streptomyces]MCQ6247839.1 hypothetical protein [Streptomyces malaysiensis]WHX23769.1 hypothetical protein QFW82_45365 [Streptomyces sp. NA07423]
MVTLTFCGAGTSLHRLDLAHPGLVILQPPGDGGELAGSPSNPLLKLPNATVTPHAAYYSEEAVRTVRTIAAEEAVRILSGQPARFPVNELAGSHPHQCASPPHGS